MRDSNRLYTTKYIQHPVVLGIVVNGKYLKKKIEHGTMKNIRSELPVQLELVDQKTMQKDSEERYKNFQELLAELKSIKKNLEVGNA